MKYASEAAALCTLGSSAIQEVIRQSEMLQSAIAAVSKTQIAEVLAAQTGCVWAVTNEQYLAWQATSRYLDSTVLRAVTWNNFTQEARQLGQLGWTISAFMTLPDVRSAARCTTQAEADAYMLAWYESNQENFPSVEDDLINSRPLVDFRTLLEQSFKAYRRGDYALTLCGLTATLEGAVRILLGLSHGQKNIPYFLRGKFDALSTTSPDHIDTLLVFSVYTFMDRFYSHYGSSSHSGRTIFRHGLLHGTQPAPNEKADVLRLFHALDSVALMLS